MALSNLPRMTHCAACPGTTMGPDWTHFSEYSKTPLGRAGTTWAVRFPAKHCFICRSMLVKILGMGELGLRKPLTTFR